MEAMMGNFPNPFKSSFQNYLLEDTSNLLNADEGFLDTPDT